jgi:protein-tyrosine phosphatase
MIDLHCHILPGIDDGAKNIEEAVRMARIAKQDGVETIVATPHLFRGDYDDFRVVEKKRDELTEVLEREGISVSILTGAEVHISHNLIDEIKKHREFLVINRSSYISLEFPREHVFSGIKNLFFELISEGLIPIIAHPERNSVFVRNPALLFELIQMGGLAQSNSGSYVGRYGKRAEEAVELFLKHNLIHFIGSDSHGIRSLPPNLSHALRRAEMIIGEERARALVYDNPKAVVEDRPVPEISEPMDPKRKKRSFRVKIPRLISKNDDA